MKNMFEDALKREHATEGTKGERMEEAHTVKPRWTRTRKLDGVQSEGGAKSGH